MKNFITKYYSESWIYIMLLTTLTIFMTSLDSYTFIFLNTTLSYGIFLLPLVFYIVMYIVRKYRFLDGLLSVIISSVLLLLFSYIMSLVAAVEFNFQEVSILLFSYMFAQLINIFIYYFLVNNTKIPFTLILLNLFFASVIYQFIYVIISLDLLITESYWMAYFITLGIQLVVSLFITTIEYLQLKELYKKINTKRKTKKQNKKSSKK